MATQLVTVSQEGGDGRWYVRVVATGELVSTHPSSEGAAEAADCASAHLAIQQGLPLQSVAFHHEDAIKLLSEDNGIEALRELPWQALLDNLRGTPVPLELQATQPLGEEWEAEGEHTAAAGSSQPQPEPQASAAAPPSAAAALGPAADGGADSAPSGAAPRMPAAASGAAGQAARHPNPWVQVVEAGQVRVSKVMCKSDIQGQCHIPDGPLMAAFGVSEPPCRVVLRHATQTYPLAIARREKKGNRMGAGWGALCRGLALQAGDTLHLQPAPQEQAQQAGQQQAEQALVALVSVVHAAPAAGTSDAAAAAAGVASAAAGQAEAAGAVARPSTPGSKRTADAAGLPPCRSPGSKQQRIDAMLSPLRRQLPQQQQQQQQPAMQAAAGPGAPGGSGGHAAAPKHQAPQQPAAAAQQQQQQQQQQDSVAQPASHDDATTGQHRLLGLGSGAAPAAAGGGAGGGEDPFQLYLRVKPAVAACGLPAEQRTLYWQAWMQMPPWRQRMHLDMIQDIAAEGPALLAQFIQREVALAAAPAAQADPSHTSGPPAGGGAGA